MPVPVRLVVWPPLGASSVRVSVPETAPAVVGEKTMTRLQLVVGASVELHVEDAIIKPGLSAVFARCSGRPPLLVSVSVCAGALRPTPVAGKLSDAGLSETPGGATPVPLSATVCERN